MKLHVAASVSFSNVVDFQPPHFHLLVNDTVTWVVSDNTPLQREHRLISRSHPSDFEILQILYEATQHGLAANRNAYVFDGRCKRRLSFMIVVLCFRIDCNKNWKEEKHEKSFR